MKTPFFWIGMSFGLGVISEQWIGPAGKLIAWILFWILLPILWWVRQTRYFLPAFILFLGILGYVNAEQNHREPKNAVHRYLDFEESKSQRKPLTLYGRVSSQAEIKIQGRKKTLSFTLEASELRRRKVSGHVQVFLFQPSLIPSWGDHIRLWGWLEKPKPMMNPGEFDYQTYLKRQGIQTVFRGYGRSVKILKENPHRWLTVLFKIRQRLMEKIENVFESNVRAVFKALITGSQKEIPDALRDDFMKTGTSHLLAVSGLNITLVVGSFFCLFLFAGISQKISALLGIGLILVYTLIAGCGAPVLRAAWMSGCAFFAILVERERSTFNALCFAFFVLILMAPDTIYQIGFQLSFLSVAGLMLFAIRWEGGWSWLESFQSTLAASLATLPLVLYYFHVASWMSFIANLLAIPLFHLAQMLGFFALMASWVPWVEKYFVSAASGMLKLGLGWIHLCASFSWGYKYFTSPSILQILTYYFLLGIMILLWKFHDFILWKPLRKIRILILSFVGVVWVSGIALFFFKPSSPEVLWTFFSAGKNEMVSFQTEKSVWLLHAGRGKPSSQVRWILEPYLRSRGIRTIQGVIMSDLYRKHWGGLESLNRNFKIQTVFYPEIRRSKWLDERTTFPHSFQKIPLRVGDKQELASGVSLWVLDYFQNQLVMLITVYDQNLLTLPHLDEKQLEKISTQLKGCLIDRIYFFSDGNYSNEALKLLATKFPLAKWIASSNPGVQEEFLKEFKIQWIDLSRTGALSELGRGNRA